MESSSAAYCKFMASRLTEERAVYPHSQGRSCAHGLQPGRRLVAAPGLELLG